MHIKGPQSESRLISYDNKTDEISWFYEDHKTGEKIIVKKLVRNC